MADLISKYFEGELTEAEDQALSEILLNSPADSIRFAELAQAAYVRYGLPEPKWPGKPGPASGSGAGAGWTSWVWVSAALVGLGFAAFRWYYSPAKVDLSVDKTALAVMAPKALDKTHSKVARASVRVKATSSTVSDNKAGASDDSRSEAKVIPDHLAMVVTPVNLATQNSYRPHSDLAVILRWPSPKQVRVRVVDSQGIQVVLLYQGLLQKGRWVFDWDGRLTNGNFPTPGHYQILVESGSMTQRKRIVIKEHPHP